MYAMVVPNQGNPIEREQCFLKIFLKNETTLAASFCIVALLLLKLFSLYSSIVRTQVHTVYEISCRLCIYQFKCKLNGIVIYKILIAGTRNRFR